MSAAFDPTPIDLLSQALYEGDPDPTYAWMRAHAPAYWDAENELWGITRHADIVAIERDTATFTSALGSRPNTPADPTMINTDDPLHTRLRRAYVKRITPRGVRRYEKRVREITAELIDAVAARGECDVVQDLAIPLPVRTIVEAIGFEADEWRDYAHWAETTMAAGGGPRYFGPGVLDAAMAFAQRAGETLVTRKAAPSDDLMSLLDSLI